MIFFIPSHNASKDLQQFPPTFLPDATGFSKSEIQSCHSDLQSFFQDEDMRWMIAKSCTTKRMVETHQK
jgi:hypothetical protein